MADEYRRVIRAKVDLDEPIQKTILRDAFVTESAKAHEFRIQLWRGGKQLKLSGLSVSGYFWRYKDDATIPLTGAYDMLKDEVLCILPEACYAMRGMFSLTIVIADNYATLPVFVGEGQMIAGRGDVMYDPEGIIPSVADIIAKFEEMDLSVRNTEAVVEQARVAIESSENKSNAAAAAANAAAENADNMAGRASLSGTYADNMANAAYNAARKIDNMTVSAVAGDEADAQISEEDGAKHIALTLPRGKQGIQGLQGPSGGYYTPNMNGTMLETWEGSNEDMPSLVVGIDLRGKNFTILGTYETLDALTAAVPSPEQGDVYNVGESSPYDMYMWDTTGGDDDNPIVSPGEWILIGKSGYSDTGGGTGTVRSVNGVLPNEAGNVVLELSSLGKVVQQIAKVPTADEEADAIYTVLYTDGTTYQFTVPSGNAPVTSVNGKTGAVMLGAADVGALPSDTSIPAKTSELTNDSGFITKAVSELTNYYLKSETYTRNEINERISAIPKFAISVVSALPTSGISETTIYLVGGGDGSDLYTEYIRVNGAWEILGSQRVDLTGYATETWVSGQLAGYQPAGDYATKSELPTVTAESIASALGYTPADTKTVSQLSEEIEVAPDYVVTEADAVISRTLDAQTSGRVFTLAAISDMHYGSGGYTDGVLHASQALKRIAGRIKLDTLAVTGDYTDLYASENYDGAIADVQAVNALLSGVDTDMMTLVGNHDFHEEGSPKLARTLLGKNDNVVWGNRTGGYYYRDFDDHKLRVIALNTSETGNSNICCSAAQYSWFVSMLDMSAKADAEEWQILILSHHPLDWYENAGDGVYRFAHILDAYANGKSWSGGGVSCNFANKNAARIVCNIHGHIHNLKVDKIILGNPANTTTTTDVYRMCMPESCLDRPQPYGSPWNTDTAYTKTANTADDTSFTVLCIDLENYTIRAVNYGAGVDRELVYYDPSAPKYTNMLTKAVGSDGKPFNGGQGWKAGYRINSSGTEAQNSDYCVTGFIPVKDRDVLYLENMNFVVGSTDTQPNTRIATYTSSFALKRIMLSGEVPNNNMFNAMLLDEDGGTLETGDAIGRLRLDTYDADTAYVRFSTKKIDNTSIVTVNEPIV